MKGKGGWKRANDGALRTSEAFDAQRGLASTDEDAFLKQQRRGFQCAWLVARHNPPRPSEMPTHYIARLDALLEKDLQGVPAVDLTARRSGVEIFQAVLRRAADGS